jgi:hypothetical protein
MTRQKRDGYSSWRLLWAKHHDKVFLVKVNCSVRPFIKDPRFKTMLLVSIYRDHLEPTSDLELKHLNAVEKSLQVAMLRGSATLLTLVIIEHAVLKYVFYTKDRQTARARVRAFKNSVTTHPISWEFLADPDWNLYHRYADLPAECRN